MRLNAVYFIQKEKFEDMMQVAEQDHLLQPAKFHKPGETGLNQKLAVWIGVQMAKWGARLQCYRSASAASTSAAQTEDLAI